MSHRIYECPLSSSSSFKTTCRLPFPPHMSFTAIVQPTSLTTWRQLAMLMFTMMLTADHCRSLHLLYDGPFKILEAHDKYYMFNVNGHHHGVFINQLKTEYSKQENCKSSPVPPWPVTPYLTRGAPSPPQKKQQMYRAISLRADR